MSEERTNELENMRRKDQPLAIPGDPLQDATSADDAEVRLQYLSERLKLDIVRISIVDPDTFGLVCIKLKGGGTIQLFDHEVPKLEVARAAIAQATGVVVDFTPEEWVGLSDTIVTEAHRRWHDQWE